MAFYENHPIELKKKKKIMLHPSSLFVQISLIRENDNKAISAKLKLEFEFGIIVVPVSYQTRFTSIILSHQSIIIGW